MDGIAPSFVQRVLDYWNSQGTAFLPGVDAAEVREAEHRIGAALPDGLRRFYQTTNGTEVPGTNAADSLGYKFWRLQDCSREERWPWLLVFADYLDDVCHVAIDLGDGAGYDKGAVYLVFSKPVLIAMTFEEFTKLYVNEDDRLTLSGAERYHHSIVARNERETQS